LASTRTDRTAERRADGGDAVEVVAQGLTGLGAP
jgi:hypothetical protein